MALPVFGHHDAARVGVAAEVNAEEVEDLALVEVGRGPDAGDAVDDRVGAIEADDQTKTGFEAMRKNVIGDLEAGLGGIPVDGGYIFKKIVDRLNGLTGSDNVFAGDGDSQFVAVILGVGGEVCQRNNGCVFRMGLEDGLSAGE